MNTLQIFFSAFWPVFAIMAPIYALISWGARVSLDRNVAWVRPGYFKELSGFPRKERARLLHEADRAAFARWWFAFSTLMHTATISGAMIFAQAIPKVTMIRDSFWTSMGLVTLFIALGSWISSLFEVRRIRPFLRVQIEKTRHSA
jgi:hypothetical protein